MPWITNQFDGYWFRIHARKDDTTAATIFCQKGGTTVAWLTFNYGAEKSEAKLATNDVPLLYYPASMLGPMLETIRQEKPLYVHMNPESAWGYVTSSIEPVGENEPA